MTETSEETKTARIAKFLLIMFYLLFSAVASNGQGQDSHPVTSSDINRTWHIFYPPTKTYQIQFPSIPQNLRGTAIYVSKDRLGNAFLIQEWAPPEDVVENQSPKETLQLVIKMLVLKNNVSLSETVYSVYNDEYVAVDFTGKITTHNRVFKGKIILEREESLLHVRITGKRIYSFNAEL